MNKILSEYLHDSQRMVTVVDEVCPTCGGDGIVHSHNPHCWDCCYPFIGKKHIWQESVFSVSAKIESDPYFENRY